MTILVRPVGPDDTAAVHAFFDRCASSCFCRYWHFGGNKNEWLARSAHTPEENRTELDEAIRTGSLEGRALVAIFDDAIVGWMKLTPRGAVPKLRSLPVYRSLDLGPEDTTYAIGCMLVDPAHRRRGVASALVGDAARWVASWGGRAIEAYPRRSDAPLYDEEAWMGHESTFLAHGFVAVHDVAPYPVMRRILP